MSEMNVNATASASASYSAPATSKPQAEKKTQEAAPASQAGVVFEKTEAATKPATYSINKMSAEDRAALVQQLKAEDANRRSQLSDLVSKMLSKQAGASNLASMFSPENLKNVSAADIAQAKEDISEDGYWGIKKTSQRLFDFAAALAGDDVEKMKEMEEAMEKGFKKAAGAWGTDLPDICKDTMNAAHQLFADYYASKQIAE